jgi:hypothetical protein
LPGKRVVVYVTSQKLYYDSIITADLPQHGPFQDLVIGDKGLETEFGPGDQGYVGGRWRMENEMGEVVYFSCPLLGPGRATP